VVISIISLLVSISVPSLIQAKEIAKQTTCLTQVAGQMRGVHIYATDCRDAIPVGPNTTHPWFNPLKWREMASNQMHVAGPPFVHNAHGVLVETDVVPPEMMFCPDDTNETTEAEKQQAKAREKTDVHCSYLYRQMDEASGSPRLGGLGKNGNGDRVTAMILDMNSKLILPGAPVRINHRGEKVNIAFVDGSAEIFDQPNEEFTLKDAKSNPIPVLLDEIIRRADALRQ
jgi:prepilin-type processing-associated H-X9-DG protein